MKRSILYTAVFSAMMMVTGCGGGDDSSNRNDKENVQLDTSPIKQNTLYGANIDGIPSYYVDDGQNQVSYFNEDNQWYGVVENKDGKTSFSFSEDFTEFTASNNNENQTLKIKQIDDKTVYQTVSDLNGNVLSAFAYFKEDGKTFIAPLDAQNQIDQTQKQDITQEYKNVALQLQQGQISARSVVTNIFSSVSAKGRATFNELMAARSPVSMQKLDCSLSVDEAYDTALEGNFNKTTGKLLGTIGGAVAGNITGIAVGALVGGILGGVTIPGIGAPIGAKWGATLGAALTTAIFTMQNASGAEIDLNNQQALNKLNLTKKELEELKKLLEEEKKKCLASGMKLINGVCKKEEEPKCLADEILVNGICKKKEPICLADEILIDGVCKKQEPKCATDEVLVNGMCKKEEPVCAKDEVLENGKCIIKSQNVGYTKISSTGKELPDNATEWSCVVDKQTGLMWEEKTKDKGLRSIFHEYSWFEDSSGYADPSEYYTPQNGYEHFPWYIGLSGYSCENTLPKCNTKAYIQALNVENLCGYSNWRLPNLSELVKIGEKQDKSNFFNIDNMYDYIWSTSMDNYDSNYVWRVRFNTGRSAQYPKYSEYNIRAVRNNK